MLYDSRLHESDFRNRKGYGYIQSRLGKDVSGTSEIRDICYSRLGEHISGTIEIRDICHSRLGEHLSGLEHLNKHNGMRLQGHTLGNVFKIKGEISWSS
jgi:hypothetical protein